MLVAIAFTIFSTLLIYNIVRSYNYRLKKLSRHMLRLREGQFDLIRMYEGKDEIGGVIRNFNMMAEKINTLINDVYKLEIQKKDLELERVRAELNYLQSQMNPHFLFNTLNALVADCSKQNYEAVAQVLNYLAKPLRRLTNWKDDIVPIEEETAFTEMYLKIEKYRFREKFFYNIEVDDEAKKYRIPKMTLQPLAENACKHGIQDIKGVGIVSLTITIAEGQLCVRVEDNGKGMDSAKLDEVMSNIGDEGEFGYHIGIRNVYRRLKLYYKEGVTFNMESRLDYGTCVSFTIPLEKLM
jgi:two-component system sensor histidine kinase YesM